MKGVHDPVKLLFPLTSIHSAVKKKSPPPPPKKKARIYCLPVILCSIEYTNTRIYKKKNMTNITSIGSISLQGCHFSKHSTNYPTFAQALSRMTKYLALRIIQLSWA